MDKLLQAIRDKRPAIGFMDLDTSPEHVEIMGHVGFDFGCLDQMFTGIDWNVAAHQIRAANQYGMSTIIRIQGYPWLTEPVDPRLPVDTARAFGIGASAVCMSVSSAKEVEKCVAVQQEGWHRRPYIMPFRKETWRQQADALGDQGIIIPLLESHGTVEGLEEIFSVKDLKCAFLGWTDLTRMLGHPFEYEHPEVLKFVDRAAGLAHKHGVALMANAGYEYRSINDVAARLHRMYERGIQILCLQPATVMFQFWCQELLDKVSGKVPLALSPRASGTA